MLKLHVERTTAEPMGFARGHGGGHAIYLWFTISYLATCFACVFCVAVACFFVVMTGKCGYIESTCGRPGLNDDGM